MFRAPFAVIKALFALSGWKVIGHPWWNAQITSFFSGHRVVLSLRKLFLDLWSVQYRIRDVPRASIITLFNPRKKKKRYVPR